MVKYISKKIKITKVRRIFTVVASLKSERDSKNNTNTEVRKPLLTLLKICEVMKKIPKKREMKKSGSETGSIGSVKNIVVRLRIKKAQPIATPGFLSLIYLILMSYFTSLDKIGDV